MLREPRGYPASNCNLVLPPTHPDADAGFIIMEQVEYPPMSGTNTMCVATALIESGMVEVTEPVTTLNLESPAGLIKVTAEVRDGKAHPSLSKTSRHLPCIWMPRSKCRNSVQWLSTGPLGRDVLCHYRNRAVRTDLTPDRAGELAGWGDDQSRGT
ncbi:MAG: hypothetical protein CM1200mP41_35550 [Gammaproteobacteria bacterium]|nr:MAG: hypothetical protein CM1200mP41_35550 [Gammaproteobacteria bacterium]